MSTSTNSSTVDYPILCHNFVPNRYKAVFSTSITCSIIGKEQCSSIFAHIEA